MSAVSVGERCRAGVERRLRTVMSMEGFWREIRRLEDAQLPGICAGVFLYPADIGRPSAFRLHHPFVGRREAEAWRIPFDRDAAVAYLKANPACGPFRLHEVAAVPGRHEFAPLLRTLRGNCGCHFRLITPLWDGARFIGAICFHRQRKQGDYADGEIALLTLLQPQLSAVAVRLLRIGAIRLHLRCLRTAVGALTEPSAAYDLATGSFRVTGAWRVRALEEGPAGRKFEESAPPDIVAAARAVATGGNTRAPATTSAVSIKRARRHGDVLLIHRTEAGAPPTRRAIGEAAVALTPAERAILDGVARGLSNPAIAAQRGTSPHTVHRQVSALCVKLGAPNRYALIGAWEQPGGTILPRKTDASIRSARKPWRR